MIYYIPPLHPMVMINKQTWYLFTAISPMVMINKQTWYLFTAISNSNTNMVYVTHSINYLIIYPKN